MGPETPLGFFDLLPQTDVISIIRLESRHGAEATFVDASARHVREICVIRGVDVIDFFEYRVVEREFVDHVLRVLVNEMGTIEKSSMRRYSRRLFHLFGD